MKYAKYLARASIPEWQSHYFKYKKLKKQLKHLVKVAEGNREDFQQAQQAYVELLFEELESVNQFYETKEKEIVEQYAQLKELFSDTWKKEPAKRSFLPFPSFAKARASTLFAGLAFTPSRSSISNNNTPTSTPTSTFVPPSLFPPVEPEASLQIPPPLEKSQTTNSTTNKKSVPPHPLTLPSTELSAPNRKSIPPPSPLIEHSTRQEKSQANPPVVRKFVPPPIDTTFNSENETESPPRSPIRDSETPQHFMPHGDSSIPQRVTLAKRFRFAIKRSLEEIHRGLSMLKDFSSLNSVGFRKIIKKHDKVPNFPTLSYFLEHQVYKSHFHTSDVPNTLMAEVETLYANIFTRGNTRQAMDKLRVPPAENLHDWVSFRFGLFVGICAILALNLIGTSPNLPRNSFHSEYIMYVFRFLGIPILWLWTFAFVMLIWNSVRINYVFIFGWDPRNHITARNLFEISGALSAGWLFAFNGYYKSIQGKFPYDRVPGAIYPLCVFGIVAVFLVLPFNSFYRSGRWWMYQTMFRIVRTPFLPVKFKDFFYTNQFTSLKYAFSDMGDTLYFYIVSVWKEESVENTQAWSRHALVYRPILQAYPSFLRLLQCLRRYKDSKDSRHLLNTGKYTFSVMTVLASGLRKSYTTSFEILVLYCVIASISTLYSWLWDVVMDWDLGYKNKKYLRSRLIYKKKWVYYFAIVADLLLRCVWAVTLGATSPSVAFSPNPMATIASVTEIIRRFIWNIFRLENEHLKNCHSSNANAIPTLLNQYRHRKVAKERSQMHDYEQEDEGGAVMVDGVEMVEFVDELASSSTGIRHRRSGTGEDVDK